MCYFNALIHFWSFSRPHKIPQWATFGPRSLILTRLTGKRPWGWPKTCRKGYMYICSLPQSAPGVSRICCLCDLTCWTYCRWMRHLLARLYLFFSWLRRSDREIQACSFLSLSSERLQLHWDPREMHFFPRKVPSSSFNSDIISVQPSEWLHSQQLFHILDSLRTLSKFAIWNQGRVIFSSLSHFHGDVPYMTAKSAH